MSMRNRRDRGITGERPHGDAPGDGAGRPGPGRLIPILLALYLTPALLVVLLVGGVGMLVLASARGISSFFHRPEAWPRNPVGPDSSRSS
jgi:hypothetical protein